MEWSVLDWNESAINFYRRLRAVSMDEWTGFRLTGPELTTLAGERHESRQLEVVALANRKARLGSSRDPQAVNDEQRAGTITVASG